MKRLATITTVALFAHTVFAQSDELAELKAAMNAMQETIADQNARMATLERQVAATDKPAAKPARTRAVTGELGDGLQRAVAQKVSLSAMGEPGRRDGSWVARSEGQRGGGEFEGRAHASQVKGGLRGSVHRRK